MKLYKQYVSGSDVSFKKYHCLFGITCLTEEKSFFQKKVILFNKFVLKSKNIQAIIFMTQSSLLLKTMLLILQIL